MIDNSSFQIRNNCARLLLTCILYWNEFWIIFIFIDNWLFMIDLYLSVDGNVRWRGSSDAAPVGGTYRKNDQQGHSVPTEFTTIYVGKYMCKDYSGSSLHYLLVVVVFSDITCHGLSFARVCRKEPLSSNLLSSGPIQGIKVTIIDRWQTNKHF